MSREAEFKDAQERVKTLTKRPSNEELLKLYALFKQGTDGDVSGKRPGAFDMKGRFKYDAWAACKGMGKDEAHGAYIELVEDLLKRLA